MTSLFALYVARKSALPVVHYDGLGVFQLERVYYPRPRDGDRVDGVWGVLALGFQGVHQPLHGGTGGTLIERAVLRGAIGDRFKTQKVSEGKDVAAGLDTLEGKGVMKVLILMILYTKQIKKPRYILAH